MGNAVTPFESASKIAQNGTSQATKIEQSRAVAEVQAAVVVAQSRPRSTAAAMSEMREVCRILGLAERAFFRFPRGGENVTGETVYLARELARIWGNCTYGIAELARDDAKSQSEMMAFAWDLQTNARAQTTFIVPHSRDTRRGPVALAETRDIYENNANMGARRLREMIFSVLPVWFREEAADLCRRTLEDGGGKPLVQRIADCIAGYQGVNIGRGQLEKRQGRKADEWTAEDVASLGVIFKSIKRGEINQADEFPRETPAAALSTNADGFEAASAGLAQPQPRPRDAVDDDAIPALEQPAPQPPAEVIASVDAQIAKLRAFDVPQLAKWEASKTVIESRVGLDKAWPGEAARLTAELEATRARLGITPNAPDADAAA